MAEFECLKMSSGWKHGGKSILMYKRMLTRAHLTAGKILVKCSKYWLKKASCLFSCFITETWELYNSSEKENFQLMKYMALYCQ